MFRISVQNLCYRNSVQIFRSRTKTLDTMNVTQIVQSQETLKNVRVSSHIVCQFITQVLVKESHVPIRKSISLNSATTTHAKRRNEMFLRMN